MNKKLLILVVFCTLAILIGGMNSTVLIGTQYTSTKPGYSFDIGPWWNTSWSYRKLIIINYSQVDSDLNNFPILVNITDTDLRDDAQDDGDDISFVKCWGRNIQLNHEIEHYDNTSGKLVAWVNVTSISSTRNTSFYMYYGNSGCSSQENVPGTWDSNYVMVQHLNETSGTHYDSSQYGNNGIENIDAPGTQDATGHIDGADYFDGNDDYVSLPQVVNSPSEVTWELWMKSNVSDTAEQRLFSYNNNGIYIITSINNDTADLIRIFCHDTDWMGWHSGTTEYSVTNWHYIVGRAIDNGNVDLFVDGNKIGIPVSIGNFQDLGAEYGQYIGTNRNAEAQYAYGIIDEVRISNTARSDTWISTSYNTMNTTSTFLIIQNEEMQS